MLGIAILKISVLISWWSLLGRVVCMPVSLTFFFLRLCYIIFYCPVAILRSHFLWELKEERIRGNRRRTL